MPAVDAVAFLIPYYESIGFTKDTGKYVSGTIKELLLNCNNKFKGEFI